MRGASAGNEVIDEARRSSPRRAGRRRDRHDLEFLDAGLATLVAPDAIPAPYVRYWRTSRRHMLVARFSEPKWSFVAVARPAEMGREQNGSFPAAKARS
jgi:hypothetical protein